MCDFVRLESTLRLIFDLLRLSSRQQKGGRFTAEINTWTDPDPDSLKLNFEMMGEIKMIETIQPVGMGWLPDYPDFRDYTADEPLIKSMLLKVGLKGTGKVSLPVTVDLRAWCSPIENQGALGSCTANAGVGIVEYFQRRAYGKHIDASRLFLYKTTRNLLHWTGDTGAFLRTTMGALVLIGVPPEEYWPYNVATFDLEPSAMSFAMAQDYQTTSYYRLDPSGTPRDVLLNRIKIYLGSGLPSMFGFTVYNSYDQANVSGKFPFPTVGDKIVGGHALMAVGYDDNMVIKNTNPGAVETKGALLVRNSWGTGWGAAGYGWLPYDYVLRNLASDWWSLLNMEWIDSGNFR